MIVTYAQALKEAKKQTAKIADALKSEEYKKKFKHNVNTLVWMSSLFNPETKQEDLENNINRHREIFLKIQKSNSHDDILEYLLWTSQHYKENPTHKQVKDFSTQVVQHYSFFIDKLFNGILKKDKGIIKEYIKRTKEFCKTLTAIEQILKKISKTKDDDFEKNNKIIKRIKELRNAINFPPHFQSSTIENKIKIVKEYIKLLELNQKKYDKLFDEFKKRYSEEFIKKSLKYAPITHDEIAKAKRHETALKDFLDAVTRDDQKKIEKVLKENEEFSSNMFKVIGTNSGLRAYAGIVRLESIHGKADRGPTMEPKAYAQKLQKSLTRGLRTGIRPIKDFQHIGLLGVLSIPNRYFYVESHTNYDGGYALISWDVSKYCVIMYDNYEYFIITPNNIPGNALKLNIGNFGYGESYERQYVEDLKTELNNLGVKYT